MNYLGLLSQEEIAAICSIIGGEAFRKLFNNNKNEYSKLKKSCKIQALTDNNALELAIRNINLSFIAMEVNAKIDILLQKIRDSIELLDRSGKDHEVALELALQDSVFANSPKLYFKLVKQQQGTKLNAYASERIIDEANILASYNDRVPCALPLADSNEIISLCEVYTNFCNKKRVIRHADLSPSGIFNPFHSSDDKPLIFANRDKLYYVDGPSEDGFYGVWNWSAVPNLSDPNKDYVESRYNKSIEATEIVILNYASSLEELIALLKQGIKYQSHSSRVMFAFSNFMEKYTGILCRSHNITEIRGKAFLSESFAIAPVYEFTSADILELNNGLSFYRNAFAGIPVKLYQLMDSVDIVKGIVSNSISWKAYKTIGITRTEFRNLKNLLAALPVNDIKGQIQATCHCSAIKAEELLETYLDSAYRYVDGNSIEDEILLSAVSANTELQKRTKELIREDLKAENAPIIAQARLELDELEAKLAQANISLETAQGALEETKCTQALLSQSIAEKERLAQEVELAVAQRIEHARTNAADFIASLAFTACQPAAVTAAGGAVNDKVEAKVTDLAPTAVQYRVKEESDALDELEAHDSWAEALATVEIELNDAGVASQHKSGLAAFLCSAFIEKQPLLLVGPNALDIVQAFSAALFAKKCGVLSCEGAFSSQVVDQIGSCGEKIVVINNLLAGGWINRLPELLSKRDIHYLAVHPYAEDLQVEPKSLYSFMLPLFTELFVDNKATGEYYGGYFSDSFKHFVVSKKEPKVLKVFSELKMSSFVKNRISCLLKVMHALYPEAGSDEDFLFAVLPFAYATMAIKDLAEIISNSQLGFSISERLSRELKYVLELSSEEV